MFSRLSIHCRVSSLEWLIAPVFQNWVVLWIGHDENLHFAMTDEGLGKLGEKQVQVGLGWGVRCVAERRARYRSGGREVLQPHRPQAWRGEQVGSVLLSPSACVKEYNIRLVITVCSEKCCFPVSCSYRYSFTSVFYRSTPLLYCPWKRPRER